MNNIGLISNIKLPRQVGDTVEINETFELSNIIVISGTIDLGFMIFDENGTMGVCTEYIRDLNGYPVYTFRTTTLNTEIDINSILSQSY